MKSRKNKHQFLYRLHSFGKNIFSYSVVNPKEMSSISSFGTLVQVQKFGSDASDCTKNSLYWELTI